jgi:hypothetical protein
MKLLSSFVTFLPARLGRVARSLQAPLAEWAPRPAPVPVPIPIRADRNARHATEHRQRRAV